MGRRNLPDYIKFELIQKKKEILLEIGKKTQGMRTDLLSPSDKKLEEPHDTRKLIAKDLGWSTGKVAMAEMVYKKGPEELKEKLRKEEVSIKQAKDEKVENFSTFCGNASTAKEIAKQAGVFA